MCPSNAQWQDISCQIQDRTCPVLEVLPPPTALHSRSKSVITSGVPAQVKRSLMANAEIPVLHAASSTTTRVPRGYMCSLVELLDALLGNREKTLLLGTRVRCKPHALMRNCSPHTEESGLWLKQLFDSEAPRDPWIKGGIIQPEI